MSTLGSSSTLPVPLESISVRSSSSLDAETQQNHDRTEQGRQDRTDSLATTVLKSRTTSQALKQPPTGAARNPETSCDDLANFLSTDGELQVFRRFSKLSLRTIIVLQRHLTRLEIQLERLNSIVPDGSDARLLDDFRSRQLELSGEISTLLKQYGEAVLAHKSLLGLTRASDRQTDGLKEYLDVQKLAPEEETSYLLERDDLLSFVQRKHEGFFGFIYGRDWLMRLLQSKVDKTKSANAPGQDGHVTYYSESRVHKLRTFLMLLTGWIFLIVPLIILVRLKDLMAKVGAISVCVVIFSTGLTTFTHALDWEVYAATAAYCAVLAVFLQS